MLPANVRVLRADGTWRVCVNAGYGDEAREPGTRARTRERHDEGRHTRRCACEEEEDEHGTHERANTRAP
eukprot:2741091-Prymnesium_polylepis.1